MKKLKIYLFIFFASALVLGCRAVKAVGNFFTGTTEKAIETTEKVVGSTIKGVPVEVEHNFSLEPVIIWAIIAIMIALAARYLINKYVYGKKITKK